MLTELPAGGTAAPERVNSLQNAVNYAIHRSWGGGDAKDSRYAALTKLASGSQKFAVLGFGVAKEGCSHANPNAPSAEAFDGRNLFTPANPFQCAIGCG